MEDKGFCSVSAIMVQNQICLHKEDGRVKFFDVVFLGWERKDFLVINAKFVSNLVATTYQGTTVFLTKVSPN